MHKLLSLICVTCILLSACESGQNSQPATNDKAVNTPQLPVTPIKDEAALVQQPDSTPQQVPIQATQAQSSPPPEPRLSTTGTADITLNKEADANKDNLKLANKSGCLACHKIEKKLVGPAWQDVAAKYQGDTKAKSTLIDKIKKGGRGNWTDITGGAPMPPYSPRVSDENIERLVTFVLSLGES